MDAPTSDSSPIEESPATQVITWGSNQYGALARAGVGAPRDCENLSAKNVVGVSCGPYSLLAITIAGEVLEAGSEDAMALTDGISSSTLHRVDSLAGHRVLGVAAGDRHAAAINSFQVPLTWGVNEFGALGHSQCSGASQLLPRVVRGLGSTRIVQVACGVAHTLFLARTGAVFACGSDIRGALGLQAKELVNEARPVGGALAGLPIAQIAASDHSSAALSTTGIAYSWGNNRYGQLGITPIEGHSVCELPTRVPVPEVAQLVACGTSHTLWVSRSGRVYAAGRHRGQLGIGEYPTSAASPSSSRASGGFSTLLKAGLAAAPLVSLPGASPVTVIKATAPQSSAALSVPAAADASPSSSAAGPSQAPATVAAAVDVAETGSQQQQQSSEKMQQQQLPSPLSLAAAAAAHLQSEAVLVVPQGSASSLSVSTTDIETDIDAPPSTSESASTTRPPFVSTPTLVTALEHTYIREVACGAAHSLFVDTAGTVFACGNDDEGQLGVVAAPPSAAAAPPPATAEESGVLPEPATAAAAPVIDGSHHPSSRVVWTPMPVPALSGKNCRVFQVAAGGSHSAALRVVEGRAIVQSALPGCLPRGTALTFIDAATCVAVAEKARKTKEFGPLRTLMREVLSHLVTLNGCFLKPEPGQQQLQPMSSLQRSLLRAQNGGSKDAASSSLLVDASAPSASVSIIPPAIPMEAFLASVAPSSTPEAMDIISGGPVPASAATVASTASESAAPLSSSSGNDVVMASDGVAVLLDAASSSTGGAVDTQQAGTKQPPREADEMTGALHTLATPSEHGETSTAMEVESPGPLAAAIAAAVLVRRMPSFTTGDISFTTSSPSSSSAAGAAGTAQGATETFEARTPGPLSPALAVHTSTGLDIPGVEAAYVAMLTSFPPASSMLNELVHAASSSIDELERAAPTLTEPDAWRGILTLLLNPVNSSPAVSASNVARIARCVLALPQTTRNSLFHALGEDVPGVIFGARLVKPWEAHLSHHIKACLAGRGDAIVYSPPPTSTAASTGAGSSSNSSVISHVIAVDLMCRLLRLAYNLNESLAVEAQTALSQPSSMWSPRVRRAIAVTGGISGSDVALALASSTQWDVATAPLGALVPTEDSFNNKDVSSLPDTILSSDFARWLQAGCKRTGAVPTIFCGYPFLFDAAAKKRILLFEARHQQNVEMTRSMFTAQNPFLVLQVRRSNLSSDTLHQLSHLTPDELRKPIKVVFVGEEAVDAGGVSKELFQLLVRDIFNPDYGLFCMNDARELWFSMGGSVKGLEQDYYLAGLVLGLSIYNSQLLDVHFPSALYKKLLGHPVGLYDLRSVSPHLAKGFAQLLAYAGDDVESVFCLDFEAPVESFGADNTVVELIPGGKLIPVTAANRYKYVAAYVDFILSGSIAQQFSHFARGFKMAMSGNALTLFRAEELELLVTGTPHLDFTGEKEALCVCIVVWFIIMFTVRFVCVVFSIAL